MTEFNEIFKASRQASKALADKTDAQLSQVLVRLSGLVRANIDYLIRENSRDLERMDKDNPLYDRLQLTAPRLEAIADDLVSVSKLPSPVGEEVEHRTLANGIDLRQVRVPYGVIGVIYEARPNVTFDVFSLCLRTGNACVLKGGRDAEYSNLAAIKLIHQALREEGFPEAVATLLPSTHEATAALLGAVGYVDLCIPRGGRRLIDFVRDNARVPVIETGAGVVHVYFHTAGDLEMGRAIVNNAKTRRVSVCNALDTLVMDASRLADLGALTVPLAKAGVELYADPRAFAALEDNYPAELLVEVADDENAEVWDTEWMDYKMGIRTVEGLDKALEHISRHGSGHSESIVTADEAAADRFRKAVDASCVYVNLPTSFTDGGQFGLGAEIGISTQKLGPRPDGSAGADHHEVSSHRRRPDARDTAFGK